MTNFTTILRTTLAVLCLGALGCNSNIGNATEGGGESDTDASTSGKTTNSSSDPTDGGEIPFGFCDNKHPCPDGQFCFNGICEIGCNSDNDCAENQYCATDDDRLCHNKTVTTCPEVPCAETQVCVNGFCSTPPPEKECEPFSPDDGCEKNAVCAEIEEGEPKCYTFPYCAQDDTCPVGTQGAVCNVDLLPNKDKICLVGLCTAASHCPKDWKCVKFEVNGVIGYCSSGAPGNEC
ncbi:MAG TPA: hypothetical protein VIK91_26665, partial [Nannocystis sp.]